MTGYGLASTSSNDTTYTVEIKSLNSKFLELALKLPKVLADKEFTLRSECNKLVERGKVSLAIHIEHSNPLSKAATIKQDLLKNYYQQLKSVAADLDDQSSNLLQLALNFPDVVQYEVNETNEEEWQHVYGVFKEAWNCFEKFRIDEGHVLKKDLIVRIDNILSGMKLVEAREPARMEIVRGRLNQHLEQAIGKDHIDHNRFEQELIFYIDKMDITEEKIRLKSHCDYFLQTLNNQDANGKKLGFISQEIGREINTMGSKANDAQIQQLVVGMKEELEKVKEQLLNVL